jgi:membrane protein insertion efficiency factor YidD
MEAVERYGVVRGGGMAAWRVLQCHPFVKGGLDPVVKEPRHTESCRASLGRKGESPVPTHVRSRAVPTYKITSY